MLRSLAAVAVAVGTCAVGALVVPLTPVAAVAPTTCTDGLFRSDWADGADYDKDGHLDVAFGQPSRAVSGKTNAGAVHVATCTGTYVLDARSAGLGAPVANGRFGAATAAADLDYDGYSDLLVTAPGQSSTGVAVVVFGSASGLGRGKAPHRITVPGLKAGDRFGASLLLVEKLAGTTGAHAIIGAPGTNVGKATDAGAVHVVRFTARTANVAAVSRWVQGAKGLPGKAEKNDRFGEVLAATGWDDGYLVGVGVPRENVGSKVDAGTVYFVRGTGRGVAVSMDSKRVPGRATAGDLYGAAFHERAVGIPGRSIGKAKHAGAIQILTQRCASVCHPGTYSGSAVLSQATPGVGGTPESGDRLGTSLTAVGNGEGDPQANIAAGAPGEDIGGRKDAGVVTGFSTRGSEGCVDRGKSVCRTWSQASRSVAGTSEKGDRFGATLTSFSDHAIDDVRTTWPVIGSPGEDVGTGKDAGGAVTPDWYGIYGTRAGDRLGEVAPALFDAFGTRHGY